MELDVVTSRRGLQALEADWTSLLQDTAHASPFDSYPWISTWWRWFGGDRRLHLVIARHEGRVRGIAPLMWSREKRYGIPVRRLGTLCNDHVPAVTFPVHPEVETAFHDALWTHCMELAGQWDLLELSPLPTHSNTYRQHRERADSSSRPVLYWQQNESPYLPIHGCWEDYLTTLSANARSDLRRKTRKLKASGELELVCVESRDEFDTMLQKGLELEAAAWKQDAGTAILSAADTYGFYHELAGRMAESGQLQLYFLTVADKPVAFQYCLRCQQQIYLLKPGYDPAWSRHSPSQVLMWLLLQNAFADGTRAYHFLGDSTAWKTRWTEERNAHHWIMLFSTTARGRLLSLLKCHVAPAVRTLNGALRRSTSDEAAQKTP